jgi:signal transduction histidine kinase
VRVHGDSPHVLADENFVGRVIENLVLNAKRYANMRRRVCIEDDGAGIS